MTKPQMAILRYLALRKTQTTLPYIHIYEDLFKRNRPYSLVQKDLSALRNKFLVYIYNDGTILLDTRGEAFCADSQLG